jgi:hypothetical protein
MLVRQLKELALTTPEPGLALMPLEPSCLFC